MIRKTFAFLLPAILVLGLGACAVDSPHAGEKVFETENITKITIYSYGGIGTGCVVPEEDMEEFVTWLGTFKVGAKLYNDAIPVESNVIHAEIEYADGTTVKNSLGIIEIDGFPYYLEYDTPPSRLYELIYYTAPN